MPPIGPIISPFLRQRKRNVGFADRDGARFAAAVVPFATFSLLNRPGSGIGGVAEIADGLPVHTIQRD